MDESGKARQTWTAILGLVIEVDEPDPANGSLTDSNATGTCYEWDQLGNLIQVIQGSQNRYYSYDMLSRLTSAQTPESHTTSFSYTASGGGLCSGDPSTVCQRTDARGITTTYAYDALNRLTVKTYSDGTTPAVSYSYDQAPSSWPAWSGVSFANAKGRLVLACTNTPAGTCASPQTATAYSYDPVGRVTGYWQCSPYNCGASSIWQMAYNYDLAGDVSSWTHPAGFTITNTINAAQQITQITSSINDATHPGTLATMTYTPFGALSTLVNGCAGSGCTQTQETYDYNNRLQPVRIQLGTSSNTAADYCLVYNYYAGVGNPSSCAIPSQASSGDNGNVTGYLYQDSVNPSSGHTASYGYDALNRLNGASVANISNPWGYQFGYDRFGNLLNMTVTQGTGVPGLNVSVNGNNQITNSGFTYDAAGHLTNDGSNTYQWDGEGRLSSVNGGSATTIAYNALGQWMYWQTGASPNYAYDAQGNDIGYYIPGSGWLASLVPLDGRVMATYPGLSWGTTMYFTHRDRLGSWKMSTTYSGAVGGDWLNYPWGQFWVNQPPPFAGFSDINTWIPADFGRARQYDYLLGRWMSPDPLAGDISNPQSLNRYAYVLNNPTTLIDPLGLAPQGVNPCAYAPTRPACGGDTVRHSAAGSLQDPFSLIGIPVVVDAFVPAQFISGDTPSVLDGYAVSYALYTPGGWTTIQVGDAFSLFGNVAPGSGSFCWWCFAAKHFVKNFSLSSARKPGETWNQCVNRTQDALLTPVGTKILGAVSGVSLLVVPGTTSVGTVLKGVAVQGSNLIKMTKASAPPILEGVAPWVSTAAGVTAGIAWGLEGGFGAACIGW